MRIKKGVILAAGLGVRLLPLTSVIPKELFPVGKLALIEYTLLELIEANVEKIALVINERKENIKVYLHERYPNASLFFLYQKEPRGIGDALLTAKEFIGEDAFVLVFPDQLFLGEISPTSSLISHFKGATYAIWSTMVEIPKKERYLFKGTCGFEYKKENSKLVIKRLLPEDEVNQFYSRREIRGFGRTILQPKIFHFLENIKYSQKETYRVAFRNCVSVLPHYGILLKGKACDLGTWEGYNYFLPIIWRLNEKKE